jgi:hypothetical protein
MSRSVPRLACAVTLLAWSAQGCALNEGIGSVVDCVEADCEPQDAGSDARLPIGDAQYPSLDREVFDELADGIVGDWRGVTAGFEMLGSPFNLRFTRGATADTGTFTVHCLEADRCVPFGAVEGDRSSGRYRLFYADAAEGGQGNFSWEMIVDAEQSMTFRSLLLQREGSVLFFIIDLPGLGSFQIVASRQMVDAGSAETVADGSAQSAEAGPGEGSP